MIVALALAALMSLQAYASDEPPPAGGEAGQPVAEEISEEGASVPTAEDVLRALQSKRPGNEPILPLSALAAASLPGGAKDDRLLLPEGRRITLCRGHLEHAGTWWTLVFAPDSPGITNPRIKLLPSETLEVMVAAVGEPTADDEKVVFVVSGEVTVFEDRNYLLPRAATRAVASAKPDAGSAPAKAREPDPSASTPPAVPSAEDVIAKLRAGRPRQELARPRSQGRRAQISRRTGRVVRSGTWWSFVFESDHPDHPEPPIMILPSKNLELMVRAMERAGASLIFVVSGEVTVYRGENYLLPRLSTRQVDTGNLSK